MSDENTDSSDEPTRAVINLNVNDAHIAVAKEKFKDIDAYVDLEAAKKAKKFLTKMRTTLGDAHKREKKQILIDGRRLDGEKNRLLDLIAAIEDPISVQLTEIKEKVEHEEAARVEKIENEIERIRAFANDRHDLTVEELEERRTTLATIEIAEEFFEELTDQAQTFKDEADAKLRIALINEQERPDASAEQQRIADENFAKQKELDERQAKMDEEDEAREAEHQKELDDAREAQQKIDDARRKELDEETERLAAEQQKIDDENARIAQEAADKEEAERKEEEERDAEEQRLAAAPDVEKLELFAQELQEIPDPEVTTDTARRVLALTNEKLTVVIDYIRTEARKMK